MTLLTAACVQTCSSADVQKNLQAASALVREAKAKGAELVALPENVCSIAPDREMRFKNAFPENEHPALPVFSELAREMGIWLVAGSLSIRMAADKMANRTLVFGPEGKIAARYDKIHLFDADPKPGESYRESDYVTPGERMVLAETPWGKLGLSICYDVRFATLYRQLAKAGASIITVPAAFTVPTGQAHWHILLRARAIETGCFVLAPAQCGTHEGGRKTYGHSLIIAPWGDVLAEAGDEPGVILAQLDLDKVTAARKAVASLQHDRSFLTA